VGRQWNRETLAVAAFALAACGRAPAPARPEPAQPQRITVARDELREWRARPDHGTILGSDGDQSRVVELSQTGSARTRSGAGLVEVELGTPGGAPAPIGAHSARAALGAYAVTLGRPLTAVSARIAGAVDHDSGAIAVALLAASFGTDASAAAVLGDVTLDGRLRPNGDEVDRARAAADVNRLVVPYGTAAAVRKALPGAKVIAARTLAEAYRAATSDALEEPSPIDDRRAGEVDSRKAQELLEVLDRTRAILAKDYPNLLYIDTAGRLPKRIVAVARAALDDVRGAEADAQRGTSLGAWLRLRRAIESGRAASTTYRALMHIQTSELDAAIALLEQERQRVGDRLAAFTMPASPGLAGQLLAIGAAMVRYRAQAWLAQADRWLPVATRFIEGLAAIPAQQRFTFPTADAVIDHVLPWAQALARADDEITELERLAALRIETVVPIARDEALEELTGYFLALAPAPLHESTPEAPAPALPDALPVAPSTPPTEAPATAPATPAPNAIDLADNQWTERARARLAAEHEVLAAGPSPGPDTSVIDRLGRALALADAHPEPSVAAQRSLARLQLQRMARRTQIILGGVPAEIRWRLAEGSALGEAREEHRRATTLFRRASLLAIVAVELALASPTAPPPR